MSQATSALAALVNWCATMNADRIPDEVRAVAERCLIDTVGVTLAGAQTPVAGHARQFAIECSRVGKARIIGHAEGVSPDAAAFVNGTAAHALDFDDNSYAGFVHGSAVIASAAIAMAQSHASTGRELLDAFIVGSECEYALAIALGPNVYASGWWTSGVFGVMGACAAACRVLRLDPHQTINAMAIALSGTGGVKACFGTDAKPLLAGKAAQAGTQAALLALRGCTGPADILGHPNGMALFGGAQVGPAAFDRLGDAWRMISPGIDVKRIPVCLSSHAAIDAMQALVAEQAIRYEDIERIECDVPPIVVANLRSTLPTTRQASQFSMDYALAASLLHGQITLRLLDDDSVRTAPELVALMRKVSMVSSGRWDAETVAAAPEGAWVRITCRDGRDYERFQAMAIGSASLPLSTQQVQEKFMSCATLSISPGAAQQLLNQLSGLCAMNNVQALLLGGESEV